MQICKYTNDKVNVTVNYTKVKENSNFPRNKKNYNSKPNTSDSIKPKVDVKVINKIFNINLSCKEFKDLVNSPKFTFTNIKNYHKILKEIGKMKNGVYIFTHKPTQGKYVGRARHLPTYLRSFFRSIRRQHLKFFKRQPLENFKLEIILTKPFPKISCSGRLATECILEQYYLLLHEESTQNTFSIKNYNNRAIPLFVYNRDGSVCYFKRIQRQNFWSELGISKYRISKHLRNKTFYLNKYIFSLDKLEGSKENFITLQDLHKIFSVDRMKMGIKLPVITLVHFKLEFHSYNVNFTFFILSSFQISRRNTR